MFTRAAREESGFGLIELVIAMTMLNIGILAIVAAFNSSALALSRASKISNASALADTQMELYRGLQYGNIVFDTTEWNSARVEANYTADPVYQANMANPVAPKMLVPSISGGACTATGSPATVPAGCDPSRLTRGSDGRQYRIDTYLYYDQPTNGQQLKVITVVVREASKLNRSLARLTSTFDSSTGQ
jgi:type II secretory pathway pseudopilin PulG